MKKIICSVLCLLMVFTCFAACGSDTSNDGAGNINSSGGLHHVEMVIKDYGTVKLELDANEAPITVENFLRLDKDFVLQGGDPDGNGIGGSDKPIKGEFKANGVENNISHKAGVISMARTNDPDSASSQFFICLEDTCTFLDGNYAAFGHITEGMDVIYAIRDNTPESNNIPKAQQPIIETIRVID